MDKYLEDYIIFLEVEKNYSINTIDNYKRDLFLFKEYIKKDIKYASTEDINKYILYILPKYNETTINRKISSIKGYFRYLSTYKGFSNITEDIYGMKTKARLPKYLSIDEINELLNIKLNNKFDYRNKAMLELLYCSGLRASELINLDGNNIDFENKTIKVYGKGKKERIVLLSDLAIKYLKTYLYNYRSELLVKGKKITDALFLNNHGVRITRQGLNLLLNNIAKDKNINKIITPHVLRHSFATHLIEGGADIRSVQELLGHENVVTTEIYTHIANNYIKENYEEYFIRNKKEGD